MQFSISSFNVNLAVGSPLKFHGAHERSKRLADSFYHFVGTEVDVICFQELIFNRQQVVDSFIHHRHSTSLMTSSILNFENPRLVPSGLATVSKHPIVCEKHVLFNRSVVYHHEKHMSKGILYTVINVDGCLVHVFNVHLNAWSNAKAKYARLSQMRQLAQFIDEQYIDHTSEPTFVVGDVNVCMYTSAPEFDRLLTILNSHVAIKPNKTEYTFDASTNSSVGNDDISEYYKGLSSASQQACQASVESSETCICCQKELVDMISIDSRLVGYEVLDTRVVRVKALAKFTYRSGLVAKRASSDVSDHYPLVSKISFSPHLVKRAFSEKYPRWHATKSSKTEKKSKTEKMTKTKIVFVIIVFMVIFSSLIFLCT